MSIKDRYKYFPQMESYDEFKYMLTPFLMFRTQKNYSSDVVNTDSNGFRLSGKDGKLRMDSLDKVGSVNIFTGGSTAFGVGATSDQTTIPALLSDKTNSRWVNFSARAYVSTQEYISFAYYRDFLPKVDNIVIFSGINDLYLYFVSKYFNKQTGSFFGASDFLNKLTLDFRLRSFLLRPILNKALDIFFGEYDYNLISNRDAVNLLLQRISIDKIKEDLSKYEVIDTHNKNPFEVMDVLKRNISNWKIMAGHYNAKITYVLQPFTNWLPNRSLTECEKSVFKILDREYEELQKVLTENINGLHQWYSKELGRLCEEKGVFFYDSNSVLDRSFHDDVFVDRIHLTDFGNKTISEYILEKIWN